MKFVTSRKGHCGCYAFFHEGKYYCFLDDKDDNDKNYQSVRHCGRTDIVRILQDGGPDLLDTLRTVFDFVETGISSSENDNGDSSCSSAIVRDNPNPEWGRAFAKACLYFTREDFPAFANLELVDLGYEKRMIDSIDDDTNYLYAIDLDHNLFHERDNSTLHEYLVVSHPIQGLTKELLEQLSNQKDVEDGFRSQSFPLPHEYKKAIIDDLSHQGYEFCRDVGNSYAPMLWRVTETATCKDCFVQIFLPLPEQSFYAPLHERHMAVAELLMKNPHPHLVNIRKKLTLHGNPAVVMDAYDCDLRTARDKLSRKQMNRVIAQVVRGIMYLHQHGMVHHDIKPSNILVNIRKIAAGETEDGGSCGGVEAAIYDFQSIAIPSTRYQNRESLSWGPFSDPFPRETANHLCDNRWIPGWAPVKTSFRFLRRDFRKANPWTIDCSSVAMMFLLNNKEIYKAYKESSVSEYCEHPEFSVFFNVVNLFQSHAKSAKDACEELEATVQSLSSMDATIDSDDGVVESDASGFIRPFGSN